MKLYTSLSKELKLKVRKFWRVIPTFVEVTGEKLVGGGAFWPYVTISGNFERLQNFNFETHFLKTHFFFFKKLEFHFLVESTKIENVTFSYKTALSKDNVKANRVRSTKGNYKK